MRLNIKDHQNGIFYKITSTLPPYFRSLAKIISNSRGIHSRKPESLPPRRLLRRGERFPQAKILKSPLCFPPLEGIARARASAFSFFCARAWPRDISCFLTTLRARARAGMSWRRGGRRCPFFAPPPESFSWSGKVNYFVKAAFIPLGAPVALNINGAEEFLIAKI